MMVLSSLAQGISYLVFALASSPWLDSPAISFICFTVISLFTSIYWPASQAMVADVVKEKDRSSVFAIFYTSTNIAVVIGPILGGFFYKDYRFFLLLAAGLLNILLSIVLKIWIAETAPPYKEATGTKKNWMMALGNQMKDYQVIVRDRTFLMFILAGVLIGQTFMQLDLLLPVYVDEMVSTQRLFSIGSWSLEIQSTQAFGLILAENGLVVAIFTIMVTRWMSKYKEKNVFIVSSFIYATAVIMFSQTNLILGLMFAMLLFSFAELMTAGIQQSFISEIAPRDQRGKYFAAASLRFTFSKMIAPLSIPMSAWFGFKWTFLIIAILAIISAFIYYVMFKQFEMKKRNLQAVKQL